MGAWFQGRWAAIKTALAERRYVVGVIVAAVVSFIDQLQALAKWALAKWLNIHPPYEYDGMIFGFPSWMVGLTVLFALLFWWMLEYAVRLRKRLTPLLAISYDNSRADCNKFVYTSSDNWTTQTHTRSIRVCVECNSDVNVERCSGFITQIEYRAHGGQFSEIPLYEPGYLQWALEEPKEFEPVTVYPRVKRYLGVCYAKEGEGGFHIKTRARSSVTPPIYGDIGEYMAHIEIVAARCPPISVRFLITWNGKWNEIKACLVENS